MDSMGFIGLWKVIVVKNLPYNDNRRVGKVPKFLAHRLFPSARSGSLFLYKCFICKILSVIFDGKPKNIMQFGLLVLFCVKNTCCAVELFVILNLI